MLTNFSGLGNAILVVPITRYSYTIHMHIVFSIDMPFLAQQNSFRMKIMEMHIVESCVHGFHVYQDIWTQTKGERLPCQMEESNAFDPYAV